MVRPIHQDRAAAERDVIRVLETHHARARTAIARLAEIEQLARRADRESLEEAARLSEAVTEILGYEGQLHSGDESDGVLPALASALGPRDGRLRDALDKLDEQHATLVPLWPALAWWLRLLRLHDVPMSLADFGEARIALAQRYLPHLELEERIVFPAARRLLAPAVSRKLMKQMLARRQSARPAEAIALP
jgi:hypothetical protein